MSGIAEILDMCNEAMEGSQLAEDYAARHGIESSGILTVFDDERGGMTANYLRERIEGKTVVEIGGGIGLLALHMATYAKRVFVIEAEPAWAWTFVGCLYANKPKNVTFIFGAADEMDGILRADVALFCTHSGHDSMRRAAEMFSDTVIDVYREILESRRNPRDT